MMIKLRNFISKKIANRCTVFNVSVRKSVRRKLFLIIR